MRYLLLALPLALLLGCTGDKVTVLCTDPCRGSGGPGPKIGGGTPGLHPDAGADASADAGEAGDGGD